MKRLAAVGMACLVLLLVTVRVEPTADEYALYLPIVAMLESVLNHGAGMTDPDCVAVDALNLEWTHGWTLAPEICPDTEAVPQISRVCEIGQPLGGNSGYIIYLNEPDNPNQSDTLPDEAAAGLNDVLLTYADKKVLLPSAPLWYLTEMWDYYVADYGLPPVERLALSGHCYGWGSTQTAICKCEYHAETLVAWGLERGIDEVWITEYGLDPAWYDGMQGTLDFMAHMTQVYRENPNITRRAWFQVNSTAGRWSSGELGLYVDGELTVLGELYSTITED